MSLRTITIGSTTKSGVKQIQSEAVTWGQLREALYDGFGDVGNMRAVIRETRADLVSDDATLPEGAFTLLLTPKQIKAGAKDVDVKKILEEVKQNFSDSIDGIIDDIEDTSIYDVKAKVATKVSNVSNSLQKDLEDLKNGRM